MIQTLLSPNQTISLILIKAHKDVFSLISGDNATQKKGNGYDFIELREYASGEDIKHIDWTISSKLGKPYVKVFQEEKELNIVVVPILCASVNFGVSVLKQDIIAEICALISFSCIKHNNSFSSYICNEETLLNTKKSKSLSIVKEFVANVLSYKTINKSINYYALANTLFSQLKQKSMLFLIGDFFDTQEFDITALAKKHELIILIVRDKFEEQPLALGEIHVIDPQTQKSSLVNITKKESLRLKQELEQKDIQFFLKLKKAGVRYLKIYTDETPADKIISLMKSL